MNINKCILISIFLIANCLLPTANCFADQHKIDSLKAELKTAKESKNKIKLYIRIGDEYEYYKNNQKAIKYYELALELSEKLTEKYTYKKKHLKNVYKNLTGKSSLYIGMVYEKNGNYDEALKYFQSSIKIYEVTDNKGRLADCYNSIGNVYIRKGDYSIAIENYQKSLKIAEQIENSQKISKCLNNIGVIYQCMGNYDLSIEYYKKSIDISEKLNDKEGISYALNNIGNIYYKQSEFIKARIYYQRALKINKEINNKKGLSRCLNNIGIINKNIGNYQQAIINYKDALKINEEIKDKIGMSSCLINLGNVYLILGNFRDAIQSVKRSIALAREIGAKNEIKGAYDSMAKIYAKMKNFEKAYQYNQLYSEIKDTIFSEESSRQLHEMEARYQAEKKQQEIEKQQIMLEKKDAEIKQQEAEAGRQKAQRNAFICGFILIFVLAIVIYRSYRQKKKANVLLAEQNVEINQQKEEITVQRDEIEKNRDEIAQKNEDITDSINYAVRIQTAMLPTEDYIKEIIPPTESGLASHFILFKPKDIVSGDFYFITKIKKYLVAAAVDCTGHGIPGAFMSMLGTASLNEIINNEEITQTDQVLNELRNYIIKSLQQKGFLHEAKDGMDIALVVINTETNMLQFSGAINSLYIVRKDRKEVGSRQSNYAKASLDKSAVGNKEKVGNRQSAVGKNLKSQIPNPNSLIQSFNHSLIEIKGDKMPVAIFDNMTNFTFHEIQLQKGDSLYIFSDGYADQFGGEQGKKFKYSQFKELLLSIQAQSMEEQKAILAQTFEDWKGDLEQVDDILVMGIRI